MDVLLLVQGLVPMGQRLIPARPEVNGKSREMPCKIVVNGLRVRGFGTGSNSVPFFLTVTG
ncbi:MAG: hypothetical protein D6794_02805 [Deltaproteobacteria bacterium]|nr:MAG: hypothetical protein D6794_02805 [Deltaproteobacteria bacterium]